MRRCKWRKRLIALACGLAIAPALLQGWLRICGALPVLCIQARCNRSKPWKLANEAICDVAREKRSRLVDVRAALGSRPAGRTRDLIAAMIPTGLNARGGELT